MKKLITLAIVAMLFASCADMFLSEEERLVKKHITMYLEENLHDPSSLTDLEITYAVLTKDALDSLYYANIDEAIAKGEHLGYPGGIEGDYAVILEYRAKNAYGAYRKGEDIVIFDEFSARRLNMHRVERIEKRYSYVVDFNAFDWKTIPAK